MKNLLADDVRTQHEKSFATIKGIVEAFPEDKWLIPHGDDYYIPCRIAYHLAIFIDGAVAGGFSDPDFRTRVPFGDWHDATAETLPSKSKFLAYYDEVIARANKALATLDDENVKAPNEPERARMGATHLGGFMGVMRELAAHTGELNKMLIENGLDDIWV
jgi:hypothetical protein